MFVPQPTWLALGGITNGDEAAANDLVSSVPALGVVAKLEWKTYRDYTDETKLIVSWLLDRAAIVATSLPQYAAEPPLIQVDEQGIPEDPLKVCPMRSHTLCMS